MPHGWPRTHARRLASLSASSVSCTCRSIHPPIPRTHPLFIGFRAPQPTAAALPRMQPERCVCRRVSRKLHCILHMPSCIKPFPMPSSTHSQAKPSSPLNATPLTLHAPGSLPPCPHTFWKPCLPQPLRRSACVLFPASCFSTKASVTFRMAVLLYKSRAAQQAVHVVAAAAAASPMCPCSCSRRFIHRPSGRGRVAAGCCVCRRRSAGACRGR